MFNDTTCTVLNPEGEVGPFYVPGEYVRTNLVDGQEGVAVTTDIQFIDVSTCEPLSGVWADVWNCNSTGVYGGVQSSGNGNGNDASNLNNTFLRGIAQTDSDGVVQFDTLFPGHVSVNIRLGGILAYLVISFITHALQLAIATTSTLF